MTSSPPPQAAPMIGERLPPPGVSIGPVLWLRTNLFSGPINSIVTIVLGAVLALATFALAAWVLDSARWGVITENLRIFLIGRYDPGQAWRIVADLAIISVLSGLSAARSPGAIRTLAFWLAAGQALLGLLILASDLGFLATVAMFVNAGLVWVAFVIALRWPVPQRALLIAWIASIPVTTILLNGAAGTPIPSVSSDLWGGLLLTFLLAIVGIVLSFPLGILLALGRRSQLPIVKILSTGYIELIRGVPLVTVLFMADLILPLFLPGEVRLERVARAMGGITLFSAAYAAENIRGGLQALPSGQIEAANALGLNSVQTNIFIVLPQALRAVIPANVGLFISLLKDTTLVITVGLFEILGIGRSVLAQPTWFGAHLEVYLFIGAVFFVMCYTMSQASYRLEASMGVGKR